MLEYVFVLFGYVFKCCNIFVVMVVLCCVMIGVFVFGVLLLLYLIDYLLFGM